MSAAGDIDEAGRPRPSGSVELRDDQLEAGEHLQMVHNHLRAEIGRLVRLVNEIANDEEAIAELTDAVDKLSMRRNYERFGTFCDVTCRMVTVHHRIEDVSVFPAIAADDRYAPLIEKLKDEHRFIHQLLTAVDETLVAFRADGNHYAALAESIKALQAALFSHLGYEDEQLPEPLGLLDILK